MPIISVIMPAYNHERYIREAIDSVLVQTCENFELLIIDDASTDNTWAVISSYDDPHIRASRHAVNQGAHVSLNEGIRQARGKYISILNSDDIYARTRLEQLLSEAERLIDDDVFVFTDISFINKTGATVNGLARAKAYQSLRARCESLTPESWFFAGNLAISTSNFFFSQSLSQKVGAFLPLRYTHDWDWVLRTVKYCTPSWLRSDLVDYRVHESNTLSQYDPWRHIHENSYVQANALLALKGLHQAAFEPAVLDLCRAMLLNESFHPLSVMCYLTCFLAGVKQERMLEYSSGRHETWLLQEIRERSALPSELFKSIQFLAEREKVVSEQASMLEDRWASMQCMESEIDNRDRHIAGQAALIEERWLAIQNLSEEIFSRDQIVAAQSELIAQLSLDKEKMTMELDVLTAEIGVRDRQLKDMRERPLRHLVILLNDKIKESMRGERR